MTYHYQTRIYDDQIMHGNRYILHLKHGDRKNREEKNEFYLTTRGSPTGPYVNISAGVCNNIMFVRVQVN